MKLNIEKDTQVLADSGFQGIHQIHKNALIPTKKTKKTTLTSEQKEKNRALASDRIYIEHTNRLLKIFNILKYPYRNKQKRFSLRMHLISAVHNLNLEYGQKS